MQRKIKINAITQAQLILHMLDGNLNCVELAEATGLHYVTVLQYCRELHHAGAAHIAAWEPDNRGRHLIKVYKIGRGTDARRPKQTEAQRQARRRERAQAAQLAAVTAGKGQYVQAANGRLRYEGVPCVS